MDRREMGRSGGSTCVCAKLATKSESVISIFNDYYYIFNFSTNTYPFSYYCRMFIHRFVAFVSIHVRAIDRSIVHVIEFANSKQTYTHAKDNDAYMWP